MISYVDCLAGESSVPDLTPQCFSPVPEPDDSVRLLPRKPPPVQTRARAEGSLRRRLLSARVHHQYATQQSHGPPRPNHSTAWGLGQEVKGDANPEGQHRSVFGGNRRTSYTNPEPHPGYTKTHPPLKYQDVHLLQAPPPQFKYKPKKRRGWFRRKRKNQDPSPSTPLLFHGGDPDRKWSVHYTTQKPLHGLLFLPSTTRGSDEPSSPEPVLSLNRQNGPAPFSYGPRIHQSERSKGFDWRRRSRRMKSRFRDCFSQSCFWVCLKFPVWPRKSSVDSDDDERLVVGGTRPMTPLVLTSCWEGPAFCMEDGTSSGLPTPEEVTRRHAQTVMADIVPINITGESFDRQASVHRSLSQRDNLNRRPSLNRRTRPELNWDYSQDQGKTWDSGPSLELRCFEFVLLSSDGNIYVLS
ncbi:uncharacterized protein [Eucyclogobius newberryi]|uniref:uncharacterized protein n=1 Tax=Eucyclogobius newberryi TaxID=166745 RepID=UPI003B59612B